MIFNLLRTQNPEQLSTTATSALPTKSHYLAPPVSESDMPFVCTPNFFTMCVCLVSMWLHTYPLRQVSGSHCLVTLTLARLVVSANSYVLLKYYSATIVSCLRGMRYLYPQEPPY